MTASPPQGPATEASLEANASTGDALPGLPLGASLTAIVRGLERIGADLPAAQGNVSITIKPDGSPVTAWDIAVEKKVRGLLADVCPGWSVLGEELSESIPEKGYAPEGRPTVWIDPIEGTAPFLRRLNHFGIALGFGHPMDKRAWASCTCPHKIGRSWVG